MVMPLHEHDIARLDRMVRLLHLDPDLIAANVAPDVADTLMAQCELDHAALMVFPAHHDDLLSLLTERGFGYTGIVPSTVVRERLRARHRMATMPDVSIVHATTILSDGSRRVLEVFMAATADFPDIAERERREEAENHVAVTPRQLGEDVVRNLRNVLVNGGLTPDGGGINPHENRTVFYFNCPRARGPIHRLELICRAAYPDLLAIHLADQRDDRDNSPGPLSVGVVK